ncbi:hypothetical protein ACIQPR_48615 [Streptomyces sp. NPDC091280]|uniref:hypothetical protein n=1 Tax=Streptomyces sp. NPDC091280 TaxID=3365984 RepID=UPI00381DCF7B
MTYELVDPMRRVCAPNEYRNTETGEFEIIRKRGLYDVQESFLTPEGKVLVLAYNRSAALSYVVSIYKSDHGVYWDDPHDARRFYAWQIAESFGLVVDKEGSKAVVPASREYATDLVKKIKQDCADWHGFGSASTPADEAGDHLAEHALSLAKHLQRIGVLSVPVFKKWEVVG